MRPHHELMLSSGWSIFRMHPHAGGEAYGRDTEIEGEILVVWIGKQGDASTSDPEARAWTAWRMRSYPKSQGREHWYIGPLTLEQAVTTALALPPLVRGRSVDSYCMEQFQRTVARLAFA